MARLAHFASYLALFASATWITVSRISSSNYTLSPFCMTDICDKIIDTKPRAARSQFECASRCSLTEDCVGFLYPHAGHCSLLGPGCFSNSRCPSNDVSLHQRRLFPQDCQHGSALRHSGLSCKCVHGWAGLLCERWPYSCEELYAYNEPSFFQPAMIDVYKNQSLTVPTFCSGNHQRSWTNIFFNHGESNMSKTWSDYVDGFTDGHRMYWMGLKNIWAFNRMGMTVVEFSVVLYTPRNNNQWIHHDCSNFTLGDEDKGYAFASDPCSTGDQKIFMYYSPNTYELEDVLGMSSGRPFLSPDRDNSQQCATEAGTGWWFPDCSKGVEVSPLGHTLQAKTIPEMILPGFNMSDPELRARIKYCSMAFVHK